MLTTIDRHRRQQLLGWLDEAGQARLADSTVLIARVGGLGGPLTQSLAMAGVGRIVFFHDGNLLEEDLHRMVLMHPDKIGHPRAPQAEESLRRLGRRGFEVQGFDKRITREDADRWMGEVDIAIGAAPTYEERLTLNDAAIAAGKPFVDAAMYADDTHVFCARPGGTCLRCVIPEPPPWRDDFPVLAAASATIANIAAGLVIRILSGSRSVPWGEFVYMNTEELTMQRTPVAQRPGCPACATATTHNMQTSRIGGIS